MASTTRPVISSLITLIRDGCLSAVNESVFKYASLVLEILLLVAVGGWVWFQFDSMRAREIATEVAREYCARRNLQFLDGSVHLGSQTLLRSIAGIRINRKFSFDYTEHVEYRQHGTIIMTGRDVDTLLLDLDLDSESHSLQ